MYIDGDITHFGLILGVVEGDLGRESWDWSGRVGEGILGSILDGFFPRAAAKGSTLVG